MIIEEVSPLLVRTPKLCENNDLCCFFVRIVRISPETSNTHVEKQACFFHHHPISCSREKARRPHKQPEEMAYTAHKLG